MILCFGSAGLFLSVAWQKPKPNSVLPNITQSVKSNLRFPFGNAKSFSSQNPSTKAEWLGSQFLLNYALGFNSSFPFAQLLLPNPGYFHQEGINEVSPVIPHLTKAIAAIGSRIVVDLDDAKVYSYWGDQLLGSYPVAVGQPGWETPTGTFNVLRKQHNPVWKQPITGDLIPTGPNNPLGDRWIGFWTDDYHQIGFHGTNNETLIGQRISHGCLRMRNTDIRALYEQVRVGTAVIVRK
ncbi:MULTISPECIES: L,D-transpeptidase [unclassified Coleofasciculus]|uniref:L,D-transpeptidase n=1 Tax=unclassified Coleofasciculus TaxID=2692782 RepID=UPI0018803837|nr:MULTISPECIES: L,D-transpeptidase [unclassified Coleofasciculus]MBE9127716.1 L,D-transpeptidase [Coleofasciculus sp. LEGE 07081]MBE9149694.1 L,D-transpeptidase [Coleofasciculus sp. LEGE 07092]